MLEIKVEEHIYNKEELLIIGVGGAGINIVSRLGITDAKVRCIDNVVDKNDFMFVEEIITRKCIIIVAGLGGETGSKTVPVIVDVANRYKIPVLGLFTTPFKFEAKKRREMADECIREVKNKLKGMYIIDNDIVIDIVDRRTIMSEALKLSDAVIKMVISTMIHFYKENLYNNKFSFVTIYDDIFGNEGQKRKIEEILANYMSDFNCLLGISSRDRERIDEIQQKYGKYGDKLKLYIKEGGSGKEILVLVVW